MIDSKYVTKDLNSLVSSYGYLESNLAWQDILYFLDSELKRAQNKCKTGDNPEYRGIWQFIDKLKDREIQIKREVEAFKKLNKN